MHQWIASENSNVISQIGTGIDKFTRVRDRTARLQVVPKIRLDITQPATAALGPGGWPRNADADPDKGISDQESKGHRQGVKAAPKIKRHVARQDPRPGQFGPGLLLVAKVNRSGSRQDSHHF